MFIIFMQGRRSPERVEFISVPVYCRSSCPIRDLHKVKVSFYLSSTERYFRLIKFGPACLGTRILFKYYFDRFLKLYKELNSFYFKDQWLDMLELLTNSRILKANCSIRILYIYIYSYTVSVGVKQLYGAYTVCCFNK